jgi:hypothetical protein
VGENVVENAEVAQHFLPGALEQHPGTDRANIRGAFQERDRMPVACEQVCGGGPGHAESDDSDAKLTRHGRLRQKEQPEQFTREMTEIAAKTALQPLVTRSMARVSRMASTTLV